MNRFDNARGEIYFVCGIIVLFFFKTTIPLLKYPFVLVYLSSIAYVLLIHRKRILSVLKQFIFSYYIIFILVFIITLSLVFSDKLYLVVIKDVVNIIIMLSLFFVLALIISSKNDLEIFVHKFINLIIIFSLIVAVLDLLNSFNIFTFKDYFPNNNFLKNSLEDNLLVDTNFALLPVFFGILGVLYNLKTTKAKLLRALCNIILLIYSLQILFSGSRRGIIVLVVICLLLLLLKVVSMTSRKMVLSGLGSNSIVFLSELFLITFLSYLFVFHTSFQFKDNTLKLLSANKRSSIKSEISLRIFRYVNAYNIKISSFDLNHLIWSIKFDPTDPDSGWGKGNYKRVFPLTGENVEIVPGEAKGYLLDSTCSGEFSSDHIYSFSIIGKSSVTSDDILEASAFCYVSDDFNGDRVCIYSEGSTSGNTSGDYDLKKKSTWQKLSFSAQCKKGDAPAYLYLAKFGVSNFSSLRGYVIFAFPQYKVVHQSLISYTPHPDLKILEDSFKSKTNHYSPGFINVTSKNIPVQSHKLIDCRYLIRVGPHQSMSDLNSQLLKSNLIMEKSNRINYLSFPVTYIANMFRVLDDKDPIRNLINKLVSEDTTYHSYKTDLTVGNFSDDFGDLRIVRWKFAWQIFTKEYTWYKKLFGGGFNHLNWYGYYFLHDKTASDWPHNPFLSILLYSGIIGLLVYCFFIFKVFYYYFKYKKEYPLFFIFFLITFFFTFFSGGSPFDPPIMGFFVMLPFFIHYIHKKENTVSV